MLRIAALFAVLGFLLPGGCGRQEAPPTPTANPPLAHHVLIVSIDGCRPDVLLRAELAMQARGEQPAITRLMAEGSYTFWANTTDMAVTLPSHTSMLTGVRPEVHGIVWNNLPEGPITYPSVPTLFEIARTHGLTTSIFAGKYKFLTLARPGAIDWGYVAPDKTVVLDVTVAQVAAKVIREHAPNVIFVHLAVTDMIGHSNPQKMTDLIPAGSPVDIGGLLGGRTVEAFLSAFRGGWGSPRQIEAVEEADRAVGVLVRALKDAGIYKDTLTIVTADHGGAGFGHGPGDPRSRYIPWICVGPRVRQNYDLTRSGDLVVHTEDTFATACYFLGLPLRPHLDGKPVLTVIHDRELMQPAGAD